MSSLRIEPPTPRATVVARDLETIIDVETLWKETIEQIERVQALATHTNDVSLKAALATVETRLYDVCAAYSKASLVARRVGR